MACIFCEGMASWRNFPFLCFAVLSQGIVLSCTPVREADAANTKLVIEPVSDKAVDSGLSYLIEVQFEKGKAELDEKAAKELNDFVNRSSKSGQVEQIKILSFSDLQTNGQVQHDFLNRQKHLADSRNSNIKKYLGGQYPFASFAFYNASANPSALEELIQSSDANVRKTIEDAGIIVGNDQNSCMPKIVSKSLVVSVIKKIPE